MPASLPRARALVLGAAAFAAGWIALSDPYHVAPTTEGAGEAAGRPAPRRALKLMPQKEIVRYAPADAPPEGPGRALSVPDWELWPEDIHYQQTGLCGGRKCFFRSTTDPSHGYLVENAVFEREDRFGEAMQAYEYADMLEREHGVRHFNAAPPFEVETPVYFKNNLWGNYKDFYKGADRLIVQPSRTAPDGSIVIRCYEDRVLFGRLQYVLQDMDEEHKASLVEELKRNIGIVEARPELIQDFQLMVDPEGRTYHLDFDRVDLEGELRDKYRKPFEGCLENAVEYVKMTMTTTEESRHLRRKERELRARMERFRIQDDAKASNEARRAEDLWGRDEHRAARAQKRSLRRIHDRERERKRERD